MIIAILKSRSPAIRAPILVLCLLLSVLSACSDSGTSASQGNSVSPNPLSMAADPKLPVPESVLAACLILGGNIRETTGFESPALAKWFSA